MHRRNDSRFRKKYQLKMCELVEGQLFYRQVPGSKSHFDELEVVGIDPCGTITYRNLTLDPEQVYWIPWDDPAMDRLVFRRIPPVQTTLFNHRSVSQTDLFY